MNLQEKIQRIREIMGMDSTIKRSWYEEEFSNVKEYFKDKNDLMD